MKTKIKGISFWELYLEHIVVGIAVLVFIAMTALQFVGNPNAVNVANKSVGPSEVDALLTAEAEKIAAQQSDTSAVVSPAKPAEILASFQDKLNASLSSRQSLPRLAAAFPVTDSVASIQPGQKVATAAPGAPRDVICQQYVDSLPPEVVEEFGELEEFVPEQPYDLSWMTVRATIDAQKLLDDLRHPAGENQVAPPNRWHNDEVYVLNVKVERQELVNGSWANDTMLEPIPGQAHLRVELADVTALKEDAKTGKGIIDSLQEDPAFYKDIIQPEFYSTRALSWSPPEKADVAHAEEDPKLEQLRTLKGALATATKKRDAKKKALEDAGGRLEEPTKKKDDDKPKDTGGGGKRGGGGSVSPPGGGGIGGTSGGGGKGLADPSGETDPGKKKASDALRMRLTKDLDKLEEQVKKLQDELTALGEQVNSKSADVDTTPIARMPEIFVWAHDLTIQQGKTYRYRVSVDVYNPLYGHKADLLPEQQAEGEMFAKTSPASEWSQPMRAEPMLRAYLVKAQAQGQPELGRATAEVWRFFDGAWWMETFSVEPGDRIGERKAVARKAADGSAGGQTEIDFSTEWFLLDVIDDVSADRQQRDRGVGAFAMLQNLTSADLTDLRKPTEEMVDPERRRLKEQAVTAP